MSIDELITSTLAELGDAKQENTDSTLADPVCLSQKVLPATNVADIEGMSALIGKLSAYLKQSDSLSEEELGMLDNEISSFLDIDGVLDSIDRGIDAGSPATQEMVDEISAIFDKRYPASGQEDVVSTTLEIVSKLRFYQSFLHTIADFRLSPQYLR